MGKRRLGHLSAALRYPQAVPPLRPQGRFLMPPYHPPIPEHPVGTKLVRLKDVPRKERMAALRRVLRTAKDGDEARRLFSIAMDPEDKGGRIAA